MGDRGRFRDWSFRVSAGEVLDSGAVNGGSPKVGGAGCGVRQAVVSAMESLPRLHGAAEGRNKDGQDSGELQ